MLALAVAGGAAGWRVAMRWLAAMCSVLDTGNALHLLHILTVTAAGRGAGGGRGRAGGGFHPRRLVGETISVAWVEFGALLGLLAEVVRLVAAEISSRERSFL